MSSRIHPTVIENSFDQIMPKPALIEYSSIGTTVTSPLRVASLDLWVSGSIDDKSGYRLMYFGWRVSRPFQSQVEQNQVHAV